jgi:uncharacterized protein involved in exopolysaccharide biosynthesis
MSEVSGPAATGWQPGARPKESPLSEQNDSAADPLPEIKATRAGGLGYPDLRAAEANIDTLIGEVERLRGELRDVDTALALYRLPADSTADTARAVAAKLTEVRPEVERLRAEVADLKATLATASPGAYFSRYGERPDL